MRIGINTFHWSMNYGSTLQAYALCHVLRSMGHEPIVVDRHPRDQWNCLDNVAINVRTKGVIRFLSRCFLQFGDLSVYQKRESQKRFVRKYLPLTKTPFHDWTDRATHELKLDMFLVGSDQVWNWEIIDPRPYLLIDAPEFPAIAYGCSFGHDKFDADAELLYKNSLNRFGSISVREGASVGMLSSIGVTAAHVVDPVMLLSPEEWRKSLGCEICKKNGMVVFYFVNQSLLENSLDDILEFVKLSNMSVEIYVDRFIKVRSEQDSFGSLVARSLKFLAARMHPSAIRFRFGANAAKFLNSIMNASVVVTDSFHGSVFSMMAGANLQIVRHGNDAYSQKAFVRLVDFTSKYIKGDIFVPTVKHALEQIVNLSHIDYDYEALAQSRESSRRWLEDSIRILKKH